MWQVRILCVFVSNALKTEPNGVKRKKLYEVVMENCVLLRRKEIDFGNSIWKQS